MEFESIEMALADRVMVLGSLCQVTIVPRKEWGIRYSQNTHLFTLSNFYASGDRSRSG